MYMYRMCGTRWRHYFNVCAGESNFTVLMIAQPLMLSLEKYGPSFKLSPDSNGLSDNCWKFII